MQTISNPYVIHLLFTLFCRLPEMGLSNNKDKIEYLSGLEDSSVIVRKESKACKLLLNSIPHGKRSLVYKKWIRNDLHITTELFLIFRFFYSLILGSSILLY